MGAIIEAVGTSLPRRRLRREGSVALSVRAGREALGRAGIDASEIDILINTGVYRDRNICEPAMAPFIQRGLGANSTSPGRRSAGTEDASTFSFDLSNGSCGWLNGLQVADGFLASGRARRVLLVTSDVDPAPKVSRGLDFAPAAAAMVLAAGGLDTGFTAFRFESFAKHSDLLRSGIEWLGDEAPRFGARNANVRDEDPRFLEHSIDCAEQTASRLLAAHGVELADVDLVIPSQFPPAFPAAFRTHLGLPSERVVDATQTHGATYTAGPALAFASALDAGRAREGARVLFLGVGAGITVAAALCTLSSGGTARRSA